MSREALNSDRSIPIAIQLPDTRSDVPGWLEVTPLAQIPTDAPRTIRLQIRISGDASWVPLWGIDGPAHGDRRNS